MEKIFLEGFFLQASLILALGAQNLFVLEAGLDKQYPLVVSLICFLCDLTLIMMGVVGASTLFGQYPILKILIGVLGVGFLFHYGVGKICYKTAELTCYEKKEKNLRRSIVLAITFSVLNPHAYLDAFVLIGGFSAKYSELHNRIILGLGAACFSGVWFVMLSMASGIFKSLFVNPLRMKYAMSFAGMMLVILSGKLGMNVYTWIRESMGGTFVLSSVFSYPMPPQGIFSSILY